MSMTKKRTRYETAPMFSAMKAFKTNYSLYVVLFVNFFVPVASFVSNVSQTHNSSKSKEVEKSEGTILPFLSSCLVHFRTNKDSAIFDLQNIGQIHLISDPVHGRNKSNDKWSVFPFISQRGAWQKCRTFLLHLSDLVHPLSSVIFDNPQFIEENPQIVLIVFDIQVEESGISKIWLRLRSVVVQSYFLSLDSNSRNLSFVNLLATNKYERFTVINYFSLNSSDLIYSIEKQHKYRNNFHGFEIQTPPQMTMYYLIAFFPPQCLKLGKDFGGSEIFCAITLLSSILNFTVESSPSLEGKIGTLSVPSKVTTAQPSEWREGTEILVPLLSSKRSLPFGFVIVIDKSQSQVHFANPVAAFDTFTRLGIVLSIVTLSSIIAFMNLDSRTFSSGVKNVVRNFAVLLWMIFEYSPGKYVLNISRINSIAKLLLLIWLFVCIVLCGGYRGIIFSILTSRSTPSVPQNFQELSVGKYLPIAIDSIPLHSGLFLAYFNYITQDYLASSSNDTSLSARKRTHMFLKLLNRTVHLKYMDYCKIKVAYELQKPLTGMFQNRPHDFQIPRNFAAVTSTEGVEHFSALMKQSGDYYLIQSQEWNGFIGTENELVCTRNFILEPITRNYMRIQQSGIYDVWRKYGSALKIFVESRMMKCLENKVKANKNDPEFDKFGVCIEAITENFKERLYRPVISSHVKRPTSLSVRVTVHVFMWWGVGVGFASLIHILELALFFSLICYRRLGTFI